MLFRSVVRVVVFFILTFVLGMIANVAINESHLFIVEYFPNFRQMYVKDLISFYTCCSLGAAVVSFVALLFIDQGESK